MAKKKRPEKEKDRPKPKKKRSGKGSGALTVAIAAVITIVAGLIILSFFGGRKPWEKPSREISLFIIDEEGEHLAAKKTRIPEGSMESEVRAAITAVIKEGDGTVPEATKVLRVDIKRPLASIDFSKEVSEDHPGGSTGEILTIYSIVNTVALNFPEIEEVQILIQGRKEETLKGHIDISQPLKPDMKVVRK
ncbi:MAG: GerMN domain-containing protein [Deltaproteobacteria bacterium]|nr:GerMN domain-containing protein [Deltaproteobacteria bacterium]